MVISRAFATTQKHSDLLIRVPYIPVHSRCIHPPQFTTIGGFYETDGAISVTVMDHVTDHKDHILHSGLFSVDQQPVFGGWIIFFFLEKKMDKQTPLRDNYISCTEPVNPYHGDYVVISLSKPFCLNLPVNQSDLWSIQQPNWVSIGTTSPGSLSVKPPSWSDMSRNFIMPTHSVRTWSNGSYWWNPNHYISAFHTNLTPLTRTAKYPEPQVGGTMYMQALLHSLGYMSGLPYSYSTYNPSYAFSNPDSYKTLSDIELTRPFWTLPPSEYQYINRFILDDNSQGMLRISGLNLTLFQVTTSPTMSIPCQSGNNNYLNITLKPLVPYSDLSGCFLNPPGNYEHYIIYQDWDGMYCLESSQGTPYTSGNSGEQIPMLPAISTSVRHNATCFKVTLPVQLYTLAEVGSNFTFSLADVSNGAPSYPTSQVPNMAVVATRLKGIFWDADGEPTTAENAESVHFVIDEPHSPFSLSHTFQESLGNQNRPVFCTESNSIPLGTYSSYMGSLLFAPKCGPGMWTDLSANQPLPTSYP